MTPSQARRAYVKYAGDAIAGLARDVEDSHSPGWTMVRTGLTELDRHVTIAPRTVTVFAARPQHGKSMWLKILAKRALLDLEARSGYDDGERVFFVTLEEPSSKLVAQVAGMSMPYRSILRGETDKAAALAEVYGLAKSHVRGLAIVEHPGMVDGRAMPAVSSDIVIGAIEQAAADDGLRPSLILMDYLQLMRADGSGASVRTKTEHVTAASNGAVRLAREFRCPVVLAVQAGRDTDDRGVKLPALSDMQWASAIEQDADTIIGLWRPWVDHAEEVLSGTDKPLKIGGLDVRITESLMILGIIKTRNDGAGGRKFGAHVDPVRFTAHPIDRHATAPPGYRAENGGGRVPF